MAELLLAALILAPLVVVYLLKSSPGLALLSVCASSVVLTYCADQLTRGLDRLSVSRSVSKNDIDLAIIAVPLIITLLLSRGTFSNRKRLPMALIPALCCGGLLVLLTVPLLTGNLHSQVSTSEFWIKIQNYQAWIVGAGVASSLVLLWMGMLKPQHHGSSKKHK